MPKLLFAAVSLLLFASSVAADVTWTANAITGDGSPITAVTPGTTVTIEVTMRSTGSPALLGAGGAVFGYDSSVLSFQSAATSSNFLVTSASGPGTGIGGFTNLSNPVAEMSMGSGPFARVLSGLALPPLQVANTGANDWSPVTGVVGGPQASVTFLVVGTIGSSTIIEIGTDAGATGDANTGLGGPVATTNDSLTVTIGNGLSPAILSFDDPTPHGDVQVGDTKDVVYTVTNSGGSTATSIAFSGLTGDWSDVGGTCGTTLSALDTCTVIVRFAPSIIGASADTLVLDYNDGTALAQALKAVSGSGTPPMVPSVSAVGALVLGGVLVAVGGVATRRRWGVTR